MINPQLVDYIKQQSQAGMQIDAVRKALTDAGWAAADINDSINAVQPSASAGGIMSPSSQASTSQPTINPMVAMGGVDTMGGPSPATAKESPVSEPAAVQSSSDKFFARPTAASQISGGGGEDDDYDEHPSTKKFVTAMIVMGAVILILAGALAFVYFNLSGQLNAAQQGGGSGDPAQVATLQAQNSQLSTNNETLTGQVSALTSEREELVAELGFLVVPPGAATSTMMTATVGGMLSGNASTSFALTTTHNVRVLVANSANAAVSAALTPLANGTSTVTLTGTHPPASTNLTVTAVNGASL